MKGKTRKGIPFRAKNGIVMFMLSEAERGIFQIRASELKQMAKEAHLSSDTLYRYLKELAKWRSIVVTHEKMAGH